MKSILSIVLFSLYYGTLIVADVLIVTGDYEPVTSSNKEKPEVILDIVKVAFAAVPYFKTEERLKKYNFSNPIIKSYNRFIYNKEKFYQGCEWEPLTDFKDYVMG